jgi:hypothetical protein
VIDRYIRAASDSPLTEIKFGVGGITFFPHDALANEQIGYRGADWSQTWLVIGREDTCGDPIFVDSSNEALPVLTAMHGMGEWVPEPVAMTLRKFSEALVFLQPFSVNRQHPMG